MKGIRTRPAPGLWKISLLPRPGFRYTGGDRRQATELGAGTGENGVDTIRVMLVEDDPFWQRTLSEDLDRETDIEVVHIASTKEEAAEAARRFDIDVVLMDVNLTENRLDGLDATRELARQDGGRMSIIMLTSLQERDVIVRSFQYGAKNFITKASYADIVQAVRDAHAGRLSLHADAAPVLVREIQLSQLTSSERELYELREQGVSRTEMSRKLNKSINTIKTQLKSIKDKLSGR